ncbi:MAG: MaoC family dehydratase [Pirellulaceae bacterium]|nr:MaoC family dehydratase [Pirellulaceae bacterium]
MSPRIIDGVTELRSLVGHKMGTSDWLEIPQSMIDSFAELTLDQQWIHIDTERAKHDSPYGTTIALGFLTVSLLSHLHAQVVEIKGDFTRSINYGFNRLRFPAAVPAGARLRLHSTLQAVKELDDGVECIWNVSIEVDGQAKPALVAEWLGRAYR